jgi:hypothetical protein
MDKTITASARSAQVARSEENLSAARLLDAWSREVAIGTVIVAWRYCGSENDREVVLLRNEGTTLGVATVSHVHQTRTNERQDWRVTERARNAMIAHVVTGRGDDLGNLHNLVLIVEKWGAARLVAEFEEMVRANLTRFEADESASRANLTRFEAALRVLSGGTL